MRTHICADIRTWSFIAYTRQRSRHCYYCAMLRRARLCHSVSSVGPSVCLSVTFRYCDHPTSTGWNTSKIISRPNCLRLTPTSAIWSNGNTQKIWWNGGGVRSTKKPGISPKRCKIGPGLLRRTNRKSHTPFRLVPKSMTLDDLERPKRHSCRNKKSFTECYLIVLD